LLLFFRVDDFALAISRAGGIAERLRGPHRNEHRDDGVLAGPDGYYVTVSALDVANDR
jgi:hypothetical protein